MPETVTSDQAQCPDQDERRSDPRQESHVQLEISTGKEPQPGRAWTADVSDKGVCFHSTQCLEPGFILVRQTNEPHRDFVELEIVRRRQLADGLWEYGAVLGEFSANSVYEIPSSEYRALVDALKQVGDGAPVESTATADSVQRERQMRLTLQQVANESARGALRSHRAKLQRRRLRRVQVLVACVGGVIVGGSFGAMDVPIQTWQCLTLAVATLLLTDWLISLRIRAA